MIKIKDMMIIFILLSLVVYPVLATDGDPSLIWQKDLGETITDIDFDTTTDNIFVSDESGTLSCYSHDGDTTKWTYDFTAGVYPAQNKLAQDNYYLFSMLGDPFSVTYACFSTITGNKLWEIETPDDAGFSVDLDIEKDGSKMVAIFENDAIIYDNAGDLISTLSAELDEDWSDGIISQEGRDYFVLSVENTGDLRLYKQYYDYIWTDQTGSSYTTDYSDYQYIEKHFQSRNIPLLFQ